MFMGAFSTTNFPPSTVFSSVPQILMCYIFICIHSSVYLYSPWDVFDPLIIYNVFSSQVFRNFSVIFLFLVSILISLLLKDTLYDFHSFKFVELCFMAQYIACLGICSVDTYIECVWCCCWVEYSINVNLILLVDGVELYTFTGFLSRYSINCWGVEVSNYICAFVYFSF